MTVKMENTVDLVRIHQTPSDDHLLPLHEIQLPRLTFANPSTWMTS